MALTVNRVVQLGSVAELDLLMPGDGLELSFPGADGRVSVEGVYLGNEHEVDRVGYMNGTTAFRVQARRKDLDVDGGALRFNDVEHVVLTKGEADRSIIRDYMGGSR